MHAHPKFLSQLHRGETRLGSPHHRSDADCGSESGSVCGSAAWSKLHIASRLCTSHTLPKEIDMIAHSPATRHPMTRVHMLSLALVALVGVSFVPGVLTPSVHAADCGVVCTPTIRSRSFASQDNSAPSAAAAPTSRAAATTAPVGRAPGLASAGPMGTKPISAKSGALPAKSAISGKAPAAITTGMAVANPRPVNPQSPTAPSAYAHQATQAHQAKAAQRTPSRRCPRTRKRSLTTRVFEKLTSLS